MPKEVTNPGSQVKELRKWKTSVRNKNLRTKYLLSRLHQAVYFVRFGMLNLKSQSLSNQYKFRCNSPV